MEPRKGRGVTPQLKFTATSSSEAGPDPKVQSSSEAGPDPKVQDGEKMVACFLSRMA